MQKTVVSLLLPTPSPPKKIIPSENMISRNSPGSPSPPKKKYQDHETLGVKHGSGCGWFGRSHLGTCVKMHGQPIHIAKVMVVDEWERLGADQLEIVWRFNPSEVVAVGRTSSFRYRKNCPIPTWQSPQLPRRLPLTKTGFPTHREPHHIRRLRDWNHFQKKYRRGSSRWLDLWNSYYRPVTLLVCMWSRKNRRPCSGLHPQRGGGIGTAARCDEKLHFTRTQSLQALPLFDMSAFTASTSSALNQDRISHPQRAPPYPTVAGLESFSKKISKRFFSVARSLEQLLPPRHAFGMYVEQEK